MLQMGNKLSRLAREALRLPGEAKSKKQNRSPWVQEEALVPEAMKQHGYLSKSASPTKRFHSPKLWSCTACPSCQAAGSRRISAARESPLRGLEQGSAALWAFQRAVWQLRRIGWALDALRVHPSPRVWEGPWAPSALAGVAGLRMAATITCAMTCNYMVHPRLECGPFLGRDEGMRLQPKMVALASTNPGTLDASQAPHRAAFALQGRTLRLAPSHSQKASSEEKHPRSGKESVQSSIIGKTQTSHLCITGYSLFRTKVSSFTRGVFVLIADHSSLDVSNHSESSSFN